MKILKPIIISAILGVGGFFISLPIFDSLNPTNHPHTDKVLEIGLEKWIQEKERATAIDRNNWINAENIFWGIFIVSNVFFYLRPDLLNKKDKGNKKTTSE